MSASTVDPARCARKVSTDDCGCTKQRVRRYTVDSSLRPARDLRVKRVRQCPRCDGDAVRPMSLREAPEPGASWLLRVRLYRCLDCGRHFLGIDRR